MTENDADKLTDKALEVGVPKHLIEGLVQYIVAGRPTGDFLLAVLENNLMEAFGSADEYSAAGMKQLCSFLYNFAPTACHGSPEKVQVWMHERRRLAERYTQMPEKGGIHVAGSKEKHT